MITTATQEQTSFFDSKITFLNTFKSTRHKNRTGSLSSPEILQSQYHSIATKNIKFENFISQVFKSKFSAEDVKDQIIKYVQAIETNYNEVLRSIRDMIDKEKITNRKIATE